jgi:Gram-negative porin
MSLFRSTGKLALLGGTAVALAMAFSTPASAASMSDAGLGKRVSDLEAEVRMLKARVKALEDRKVGVPGKLVQSGNSRVKVTLYGQVGRAVRFVFTQGDTQITHVDNAGSSTRLGVFARGRLFPDVTITGWIELEMRENARNVVHDPADGLVLFRTRHTDLYFTHADLGSLHLGHGSMASDAANLFSLNGTSFVFAGHGNGEGTNYTIGSTGGLGISPSIINGSSNFTGVRENRIMYRTPRIAGFELRVAHGETDMVDFGIRYFGHPFGKSVRILGGFGYQYRPSSGATITAIGAPGAAGRGPGSAYGASLSALHVPSGISISGHWTYAVTSASGRLNSTHWQADIGWQGKIWAMGKTYISGHFGKTHHGGRFDTPPLNAGGFGDTHGWLFGVAVVQKVDAAATDLFFGYRYMDGKINGNALRVTTGALNALHVIVVGARIKF